MLELLQMWALVELLGLLCVPLTVTVFHNLPDRGWAFTKALGVTLFAFCVWLPLMCLRFLPYSRGFLLGVALILLGAGIVGWVRMHATITKVVRLNRTYIIATEVIFLGMIFLLGWLRSFNPNIQSYEMFMDEGFIAAIMRSPHLPPNDMWFANYSINYYDYAHFTAATLGKLLGQSPSVLFNTGISMFFGLTAVNLFGVSCNIVAWARHVRRKEPEAETPAEQVHPGLLKSIPFGLLSMLMGVVLGNLAATQQWWLSHGQNEPFNWFGPSRVVVNTINEFPAFSFLLSCFHAHVLTLAFSIMAIGLAFNLLLEKNEGKGLNVFGSGWRLAGTLIASALVIGELFAMNGWDYPTYLGLACVCIGLQQWQAYQRRFEPVLLLDIFTACASLAALSFLLFLPFYLNFVSPAQGLGVVLANDRTPLNDELLIYGLFAFIYISLLLMGAFIQPLSVRRNAQTTMTSAVGMTTLLWFGALLVADLLLLLFLPNSLTFVVFANGALFGVLLAFYHLDDRAQAFTLFIGALAFALVAGCEILFLKDVFATSVDLRMNTVFKFYFQAWSLLAIASGCGLFFIIDGFRSIDISATGAVRRMQRSVAAVWGLVLLALVLASMVYPLLAPTARLASLNPFYPQQNMSLDGLTYLQNCPPQDCGYDTSGDYYAIRWLNTQVQGDPGIIESVGKDYSSWGRVSAFTGLPTPMGWIGHEYQWRVNWMSRGNNLAEFERRASDVDIIYTSNDPKTVLSLMARYHAEYLYVGVLELTNYPHANLQRFGAFMQVAYSADGVTIYKVK